jgi:hypothetical protein
MTSVTHQGILEFAGLGQSHEVLSAQRDPGPVLAGPWRFSLPHGHHRGTGSRWIPPLLRHRPVVDLPKICVAGVRIFAEHLQTVLAAAILPVDAASALRQQIRPAAILLPRPNLRTHDPVHQLDRLLGTLLVRAAASREEVPAAVRTVQRPRSHTPCVLDAALCCGKSLFRKHQTERLVVPAHRVSLDYSQKHTAIFFQGNPGHF